MPALRELQRAFSRAIGSSDAANMATLVRDDGIAARLRMQIYRNNHSAAMLAALTATYPVVERLGGADWFAQSVRRYVQRFPSRCGDLQYAGDRFAQFLERDMAGTEYDYFADVARLEWAYQQVLTAAEHAPLDPASLRSVAADAYEHLVFVPRPAVRLVQSPFPILAIWKTNQPDADPHAPAIRLDDGASRVLVIRRADHVELRELPLASYALLDQFMRGASLGTAADAAVLQECDLGATLQHLLALQCIGDINVNPAEHS